MEKKLILSYFTMTNLLGNRIVLGTIFKGISIEMGHVLNYNGSAVINGNEQNALRGPHFDTIYELSNIFQFVVEVKQRYPESYWITS